MSKRIKLMELDTLRQTFAGTRNFVFLTAEQIDAQSDYTFRLNLRKKKIRLQMVKNSLARKALGEMGVTVGPKVWEKPTLLAWGGESVKELATTIDETIKDLVKKKAALKDKVVVKTAVAEGQEVTFKQALEMPTRQEIIASIVGMILGPGSAIAGCLTGPAAQVASQIATIGDRKEGEEATPERVAPT
jgi:large subunit ribosomal protein L10